jgi:two-component system CheB/CheR fusion protein
VHQPPKGGMVTRWQLGSRTTTPARTSISVRSTTRCGRAPLNLDTGLPVESLRPLVRATLGGDQHHPIRLDAVNRRGREIKIRVGSAALTAKGTDPIGAIILIDEEADG